MKAFRRVFALTSFLCAAIAAMQSVLLVLLAIRSTPSGGTIWITLGMVAVFFVVVVGGLTLLGAVLWSDWWRRKKRPDPNAFS